MSKNRGYVLEAVPEISTIYYIVQYIYCLQFYLNTWILSVSNLIYPLWRTLTKSTKEDKTLCSWQVVFSANKPTMQCTTLYANDAKVVVVLLSNITHETQIITSSVKLCIDSDWSKMLENAYYLYQYGEQVLHFTVGLT